MNPEYFMSLNIPDDLFNSSSDICNIYADLACISPSLWLQMCVIRKLFKQFQHTIYRMQ